MKMKIQRDKYFYLFMAELFNLDPDDYLTLEPHAFLPDVVCITNEGCGRELQVKRETYVVTLSYIDSDGNLTETQVYAAVCMANRAYEFLMGNTGCIRYDK